MEDQFGLGLIARAVEEGIAVIKPTGIMIFNMGGRPGQGVCERLFERRGFRITKLWQTKIIQVRNYSLCPHNNCTSKFLHTNNNKYLRN